MISSTRFRSAAPIALLIAMAPGIARAHAVVYPERTTPHTYEKFTLRVPNERDRPTLRVELAFPAAVDVVSFGEVAGWTLQVARDERGRVVRAAWTGRLPAERFVEFPFIAVTPEEAGRIVWPAVQVYEGGERVEWTGPEGSEAPASITVVEGEGSGGAPALWLAAGAVLLALLSLGIALRR